MKTKTISFWQLGKGKTFQMNNQTFAKKNSKEAINCSDNTVVQMREEDQVEVVQEYLF